MTLELEAGKIIGLIGAPGSGLTRLGMGLLRDQPGWVACVDVRGWLNPLALWEMGVSAERMVVVRCPDARRWPQVTAALVEGMQAVYAEIPAGVATPLLRRLGALARVRSTSVVLRPIDGDIPTGITHLRLEAQEVAWEGVTGQDKSHHCAANRCTGNRTGFRYCESGSRERSARHQHCLLHVQIRSSSGRAATRITSGHQ